MFEGLILYSHIYLTIDPESLETRTPQHERSRLGSSRAGVIASLLDLLGRRTAIDRWLAVNRVFSLSGFIHGHARATYAA